MTTIRREILRKFFHLTELLIIAGYTFFYLYFSQKVAILSLTALLLILLEVEYLRINYREHIDSKLVDFFYRFVLRNHEHRNLSGAIFFVISTIIAFSAFDYKIALTALLFSVFGDLAAAIMGMKFGSKKIFRAKSYIGTASALIVNLTIGFFLIPESPIVFISMAFVGTFVEMITQKLDDNLTVPLFAGFAGQCIVFFDGIHLLKFFNL